MKPWESFTTLDDHGNWCDLDAFIKAYEEWDGDYDYIEVERSSRQWSAEQPFQARNIYLRRCCG